MIAVWLAETSSSSLYKQILVYMCAFVCVIAAYVIPLVQGSWLI